MKLTRDNGGYTVYNDEGLRLAIFTFEFHAVQFMAMLFRHDLARDRQGA